MTRIRLAALALAFVASSVSPARAQGDSKTQEPTATAAAKQQSAASLLEQGAYAEEHERDFAKAMALYKQAFAIAQKGTDKEIVRRLNAAMNVLANRMATDADIAAHSSPNAIASSQAADADDPIVTRIAALMIRVWQSNQNSGPLSGEHKDLAMFGDTAVPYILQACRGTAVVGSSTVPMDTAKFCRVLSQMDSPKVAAALTELAQSIDPLTRRTVMQLVNPDRDRKLLLAAVNDPVAEVKDAALGRLTGSDSADLMPLMRAAAIRGNAVAMNWVGCHDATAFFSVLEDAATPDSVRSDALDNVLRNNVLRAAIAPIDTSVDALLRLGRSKNAKIARAALVALKSCAEEPVWRAKPAGFFARIESSLGPDLAGFPVPEVWNLELAVGSANALEPLMKSLVPQIRVLDQGGWNQLSSAIQTRVTQQTALEVPQLVAAFGAIPMSTATASDNAGYLGTLSQQLSVNIGRSSRLRWKDVDVGAFVKSLMALDDAHWEALQNATGTWLIALYGQYDSSPDGPLGVDASLSSLLRRSIHAKESGLKEAAAFVLSRTRDLTFLPDLLAVAPVSNTSDTAVANGVARLIASNREAAGKVLEQTIDAALAKSDPSVRRLMESIGQLDTSDAIRLVTTYTAQSHDEVLRSALFGIMTEIRTPETTEFLLEHYEALDSTARVGAVNRFGSELVEPAIPVLGRALKDTNSSVRSAARNAFGKFREQRAALDEYDAWMKADKDAKQTADELIKLLASPNAAVVTSAVKTLGALKVRSAYPAIIKLLDRNDAAISAAVKEAIDKLAQ